MIVIPMAGSSSRFSRAGYNVPKYMLPLNGRPLFDWSVLGFKAYFETDRFLFICRDVFATEAFIRERAKALGIRRFSVVVLERETLGQADTVDIGIAKVSLTDGDELVIFNIDTIRPDIRKPTFPDADGWLETFNDPGEAWSFVEVTHDDPQLVVRTTEKIRISDFCCTGLYGFKSRALFEKAMRRERETPQSHELYIAPIYNHLIAAGGRVRCYGVPRDEVFFSGVPQEYEALTQSPGVLNEKFALS